MEYEREEQIRIQKIINQQNKIKDEQFLGFQLPKLQENTIVDCNFQDSLSKTLNRKKQTRKRFVSQSSFSRSRIIRDDSISLAPSSNHQSFSITQPLIQSRSEKRSISHQRMSKTLKEEEQSIISSKKIDMPELIDSMKESQSTDRKFSRRNFNCASIGPAFCKNQLSPNLDYIHQSKQLILFEHAKKKKNMKFSNQMQGLIFFSHYKISGFQFYSY